MGFSRFSWDWRLSHYKGRGRERGSHSLRLKRRVSLGHSWTFACPTAPSYWIKIHDGSSPFFLSEKYYSRPSLQGISRDWRNLCLIGGLPYCHFDIIVQKSSLSNIQKTKMKSIYLYKIIIIHSHIFIFSLFHLYCDFSYFHDFGFQKFLTLRFTFDFYEQKLRKGKNYWTKTI